MFRSKQVLHFTNVEWKFKANNKRHKKKCNVKEMSMLFLDGGEVSDMPTNIYIPDFANEFIFEKGKQVTRIKYLKL